jgi:hypothetical protein
VLGGCRSAQRAVEGATGCVRLAVDGCSGAGGPQAHQSTSRRSGATDRLGQSGRSRSGWIVMARSRAAPRRRAVRIPPYERTPSGARPRLSGPTYSIRQRRIGLSDRPTLADRPGGCECPRSGGPQAQMVNEPSGPRLRIHEAEAPAATSAATAHSSRTGSACFEGFRRRSLSRVMCRLWRRCNRL